ncbi:hypothetical protein PPO43_04315 [Saprospira sp. CCB-QB6]|uniref:hypothetical protein n=1 Tax=Saprospira sp. CCB-QB6 TaxID=3023936 RepID=UPI00234ABA18|nr:hypothetical protein [Saprospira sp. CCB-QB6]WCL82324.1 hypothetical protein PPO43_04315 [Saprospira sp. CCB-QB6]
MHKIILLLLISFFPLFLGAQGLFLGDRQERLGGYKTYALLEYEEDRFQILRFNKQFDKAETEIYDGQLKLKGRYISSDKKRKYGGAMHIHGKNYLLYSYYIDNKVLKRYEEVSLYAKEIVPDSFQLTPDSITLIPPFDMKERLYRGNFVLSPDGSKLLLYDYEEEGDIEDIRGLTNSIRLRVLDMDLNLLWERKLDLSPNQSGKRVIAIQKLKISNEGVVAILSDQFREKRSYQLKKVTADPVVFFVGQKPQEFVRFSPKLGDFFYNEMDLLFDAEGNIYWTGFYSQKKYYKQGGYFLIKINAERSQVLAKKKQAFSKALKGQLLHRKASKIKEKTELRNYNCISFRQLADGRLILLAEQRPYGIHNFKSHNIFVLCFSEAGELLWEQSILKHNSFPKSKATFLRPYLWEKAGKIYLLFNRGLYGRESGAYLAQIDAQGQLKEKQLLSYEFKDELLCPELSYPLQDGRLFIGLQSLYFRYYQFGFLEPQSFIEAPESTSK